MITKVSFIWQFEFQEKKLFLPFTFSSRSTKAQDLDKKNIKVQKITATKVDNKL